MILQAAGIAAALGPHHLRAWLDTPSPELDGLSPRIALTAGRGAEVLELARAEGPTWSPWPTLPGLEP